MGCFSTCFGTRNRSPRRRHRSVRTRPSLLDHLQTYESVESLEIPQLIKEEEEEKGENQIEVTPQQNDKKTERSNSSEKKKVTFDLNLKIYEDLPREDLDEMNGNVEENNEEGGEGKAQNMERKALFGSKCNSESSSSSLISFPPNHRYQNCRDSHDELEEVLSSDESEIDYYTDDDDDGDDEVESEIKTDKYVKNQYKSSRKQEFGTETGIKELNSTMPIKNSSPNDSNLDEFDQNSSMYIDSVLNPVQNLTQLKFIKARSKQTSKDHQAKENAISGQDLSFPVKKEPFGGKGIGVDTSLSSWLVASEGTPKNNSRCSSVSVGNSPCDMNKCSPNKFEDRPILGALTIEELRQISARNSPRKSPSKSPEDMPIIGSVGSYWSHSARTADTGSSIRSTRSKFRESAEVIWDSTPFETRLEKALEKEANAEQITTV